MCIAFPKTKEAGAEPLWKKALLLPFRVLAVLWLLSKMLGVGLRAAFRS